MLKSLFGSKTRIKLLSLFSKNPKASFYVRELTRKLSERINSVRRELDNLSKLGLITSERKQGKKYFRISTDFDIFPELQALILKAEAISRNRLIKQIERLGRIKLAILTKSFVQPNPGDVDLLLVGKISRKKLEKMIKNLEKSQGREINYTTMSLEEFEDRKRLKDGFLAKILESKYSVIVDKI